MMLTYQWFVLVVLAALLLHLLLNLRAFGRLAAFGPPGHETVPSVSVLIPARNEAARIEAALEGWLRQTESRFEIVVLDDESTDGTGDRVARYAGRDGRVRPVRGMPLPPGWGGKAHACHQLRRAARGRLLVYADADVVPAPGALAAAVGALEGLGVDGVSAIPRHEAPRASVRALAPMQVWAATSFLPIWLGAKRRGRAFAAANGQFLAIRAEAYDAAGGYAAVANSVAEDAALARRLAGQGRRITLLDGSCLLTCRPYESFPELWRANARNLIDLFFGSMTLASGATAALACLYTLPWGFLLLALAGGAEGERLWLPAAQCLLGVAGRLAACRRFRYPLRDLWSHPLWPLALCGMLSTGAWWQWSGSGVPWRGRRYAVGSSLLRSLRS